MNLLRPHERDLKVDGRKLHLLDWGGEGRTPLLLLHGFTGHAHAWDTLSIALQPYFHVYALDQRGHGDSDPADVYNPAVAFDDLTGVIDQLGLRSLILIGLSMGGRNAIYFTAKRPDARPEAGHRGHRPEISTRGGGAPRAAGAGHLGEHRAGCPASLSRQRVPRHPLLPLGRVAQPPDLGGRRARVEVAPEREGAPHAIDFDWWKALRSIPCPALVLRGEHSHILDRDVAERMGKELPHGRFVEIPRAVHTLHEDNPDAVVAALKEFLGF